MTTLEIVPQGRFCLVLGVDLEIAESIDPLVPKLIASRVWKERNESAGI